jgi:hypothetical protein
MTDDDPKKPEVNGATTSDLIVTLRKPVIAHGDEVKELKFREPTAADIEAIGSPITFNAFAEEGQRTKIEVKIMFAMMSHLAAVPPSTIKQMNAKDWEYTANLLAFRFFIFEAT